MPLAQLTVPAARHDYPKFVHLLPRYMLCLDPLERIRLPELLKILTKELHKIDMFKAVRQGDLATVERLVKKEHADVNMKDTSDYTPLMWASEEGHQEIVKFLLANGADTQAKNRHGWTAQDWAASEEITQTINRGGA